MPSISTQTTTFLPAVVPVLQHRSLTKRFLARMMRKHFNDVKQNNTTRAKFQREFTANKKALTKILKDMTLTIRNNMSEAAKSFKDAKKALKEADKVLKDAKKDADKADKEQVKKANKQANKKVQEQRKFDAAVKKFSIELKTAARKESKQDAKEAKNQAKLIEYGLRAARQQDAKEKLDALSVKGDFTFIPFLGWVSE
jgi:hypothetical protein